MLAKVIHSLPNAVSQQLTKFYFRVVQNSKRNHSYIEHNNLKEMEVKILPALSDNYMYLIVDKATKEAAVVDPVDPNAVLQAVQADGVNLTKVLTTHHHWDHAGGNVDIKNALPHLQVYGGDERIGALTKMVKHNETLNIGNLHVTCLSTPCHTSGHICYYVQSPGEGGDCVVFTGDTLFLAGCGRFFEGTAEQMYKALIDVLSNLPQETKVYCGHEYTLQNLKFAAYVEPSNEEIVKKMEWSSERRQKGLPTVPSTIDEEKKYNPFMRVTVPSVMQHVGVQNPIEVMKMVRLQKDNFKG